MRTSSPFSGQQLPFFNVNRQKWTVAFVSGRSESIRIGATSLAPLVFRDNASKRLRGAGMPAVVVGHLQRAQLQDVAPGALFIFDDGVGRLVCMKAPDQVVVFGGRGTEDNSAGFFDLQYHLDANVALLPPETEIELLSSGSELDFGLAAPGSQTENGCITVDQTGSAWLYAKAGPGRAAFFDLKSGTVGAPGAGPTHYLHWRLLWRKPGVREPIEIFRHG